MLLAMSTVPTEFQYQSWQMFQSQLIAPNSLPGISGSPGHQWVQVSPPGQFPPLYDGPSACALPGAMARLASPSPHASDALAAILAKCAFMASIRRLWAATDPKFGRAVS
jgi:hypothetical protein